MIDGLMAGFRGMIPIGTRCGIHLWSSLQYSSKPANYSSFSLMKTYRWMASSSRVLGQQFNARHVSSCVIIPNGNRSVVVKKSVMVRFLEKQGLSSMKAKATASAFAKYLAKKYCSKNVPKGLKKISSDDNKPKDKMMKAEEIQELGQKQLDESTNLISDQGTDHASFQELKEEIAAKRDDLSEKFARLRNGIILTDKSQSSDLKNTATELDDLRKTMGELGARLKRLEFLLHS